MNYRNHSRHIDKQDQAILNETGWTAMISSRLFHGLRRDPVRVHRNQYMCGVMWDVEHSLAMVELNIYKTTQIIRNAKFGRI